MSNTKKVAMGSGYVYYEEFAGNLPPVQDLIQNICVPEKRLGYIKNGAKLEYVPTFTKETDDMGHIVKQVLTEEEAKFSTGLFTWDGRSLEKLCATASVEEVDGYRIVNIGGVGNDDGRLYAIVFHHPDRIEGDSWVIIVGRNMEGFTLTFAKDAATVIDAVFLCYPQDERGTLIKYVEDLRLEPVLYTREQLEAMTAAEIDAAAAVEGYTLTGSTKAEKIESFLDQQAAGQ